MNMTAIVTRPRARDDGGGGRGRGVKVALQLAPLWLWLSVTYDPVDLHMLPRRKRQAEVESKSRLVCPFCHAVSRACASRGIHEAAGIAGKDADEWQIC